MQAEPETVRASSSAQLHVVHVTLSLDYGGLERVVLHLVNQAANLGQKTSVICLERRGALAERAEALGATVYCIEKKPGLRFETIKSVRSLLAKLQPDVVHTHQIGALFYTGPAARQLNVPVIVHTEHGKQIKGLKQKLLGWWAAGYAQRFYSVSADIQQVYSGSMVSTSKMEIIANGIDTAKLAEPVDTITLRRSWNIAPDAIVVGTIGRLAYVKRQDLMLQVFAIVLKKMPNIVLLLVGDGEERIKLEAQAAQLGIQDHVCFTGFQPEPGKFLHLMSAFLLTSESEGMPLSLLEAWAAGVPVVAFRVGGLPELLHQGETGYLAEFGEVAPLARHIIHLLDHPEVAQKIVDRCRDQVREQFDVSTMARAYDRRYRELLARRHR
jgi:glycosyltransferase involved in cell wall biosynthesis